MPSQPRRRAADPRLFIGLALVTVSVLGVVGIVSAFDQRSSVYVASAALQPGDRILETDLVERRVDLDGGEGLYLAVGQLPDQGLVATEPIRAGELVSLSALGDASAIESTALVLALAAPVSRSLEPGSRVDVWMAAAVTDGAAVPPTTNEGAFVVTFRSVIPSEILPLEIVMRFLSDLFGQNLIDGFFDHFFEPAFEYLDFALY